MTHCGGLFFQWIPCELCSHVWQTKEFVPYRSCILAVLKLLECGALAFFVARLHEKWLHYVVCYMVEHRRKKLLLFNLSTNTTTRVYFSTQAC